jgi:bifunctional UDP-N-acetylglucosamine pyrophosphorylase/glucosamine-1-phosphate N-acetyltransferase
MCELNAVILAAGKGTRMESDLPKVVHKIDGVCLVDFVVTAARLAGVNRICLVVGYQADKVRAEIGVDEVVFAVQEQQLGTGHAVMCARDFLKDDGETMVLYGDTPLIRAETLMNLTRYHREMGNAVTVLSAIVTDPTGYGRIVRDDLGQFEKIVEQKDASEAEKRVCEINSGMYIFGNSLLKKALELLKPNNAQGEYYLTDTITILKDMGHRVDTFVLADPEDINGVNTKEQLAEVSRIIRQRKEVGDC